ncbi:MAG: nucleotidyltransferase domain-containing protein [Bacillales bacterium]|nr:nucleotidyltransferase domain-containing protein [Bacillales bacterium]
MQEKIETILRIIKEKYNPVSIIVYGSFADGSNNENSDLDALVISNENQSMHDVSIQNGVQLDVFVESKSSFIDFNLEDYVQLFNGIVVFDTNDFGKKIIEKVNEYINSIPKKNNIEKKDEVAWCKKMLLRIQRDDVEGLFRWHWLLVDSLEIYFDLIEQPYRGPKKALLWMEKNQPIAFVLFDSALRNMNISSLQQWIEFLSKII